MKKQNNSDKIILQDRLELHGTNLLLRKDLKVCDLVKLVSLSYLYSISNDNPVVFNSISSF